MKKILTFLLSFAVVASISAQYTDDCATSDISIQNVVLTDKSKVTFDVFIKSGKLPSDPCHTIMYATGQVYVKFDPSKFNSPSLVIENQFSPAISDFDPSGFGPFASAMDASIVGPETNTAALQINTISQPNYNTNNPNAIPSIQETPLRIATLSITGYTTGEPMLVLDLTPPGAFSGGGDAPLDAFVTKTFTWDPALVNSGSSQALSVVVNDASLPVRLTKFEANKYNRSSSIIRWETASESNTSHFQVQRAEKGGDWENIGVVNATGFSTDLKQYTYIDQDVYDGTATKAEFLYRLKIMDFDGKTEYSDVDNVNFSATLRTGEIKTFPNPATDGVHVQFDGELPVRPTDIVVYDVIGKLVYSQPILDGADYAYIDLREANIGSGSYVVQFMANKALIAQQKLIVQGK